MEKKLIKNSFYYLIGGLCLQGINFITLPIFVRILNPENFGKVTIYNTWLSILTIFIFFEAHLTIGNAKLKYTKQEFKEYINNIIYIPVIAASFFLLTFIVFNKKIIEIIQLPFEIIILLILNSFFLAIINLKISILAFDEEAEKRLKLSFFTTILNIFFSICLLLFIYKIDTYKGKVIGNFISSFVVGVYIFIEYFKIKIKIEKKYFFYCIELSIPLLIQTLSILIFDSSDRLMIEKIRGIEEVGVYSLIYSVALIVRIIFGALHSAWKPWYFKKMNENQQLIIYENSILYLICFTTICSGFLLLAPEVIKLMTPKSYWSGISYLAYIVIGYYFYFLSTFSTNYQLYSKTIKSMTIITIISSVLNLILNLILIKIYGVKGAAISTMLSYIIIFLLNEYKVREHNYRNIKIKDYLINTIILCAISIYSNIFVNSILYRYILVIILIIIFLCVIRTKITRRIK